MQSRQMIAGVRGVCFLLLLTSALSLQGCDGDNTGGSTEPAEGGGGAEISNEGGEGGAESAGTETEEGGSDGGADGGAENDESPVFCPQPIMEPQSSVGRLFPNLRYEGIDDRYESRTYRLTINPKGVVRPGTYSLEGSTPDDCAVCVTLGYNCIRNSCSAVFYADQGTVVIDEIGEGGERFTGTVSELGFKKIGFGRILEEPNQQVCLQEQDFEVTLPALKNDQVPNFELQNCETGEFESMSSKLEGQNGVWYVATAGWCPFCRDLIRDIYNVQLEVLNRGKVKPMFVVTEDEDQAFATIEYCRAYGRRYASTAADFYLDAGLNTTEKNIWFDRYDRMYGLPWNAVIEGGTEKLLYTGSRTNELIDIINELLSR